MSHEHYDIEQLLKRQMLRKPSATMDAKVKADFAPKAPAALRLSRWLAAVAACILIGVAVWPMLQRDEQSSMQSSGILSYVPTGPISSVPHVVIENTWSQVTPGSIVHDEDRQPYRPYYVESIHQASWVEEDGSEITVTYPETNVYYASLEVY